jgi:hypothetical protein
LNLALKLGGTDEWTFVNSDQQYRSFGVHQAASG